MASLGFRPLLPYNIDAAPPVQGFMVSGQSDCCVRLAAVSKLPKMCVPFWVLPTSTRQVHKQLFRPEQSS